KVGEDRPRNRGTSARGDPHGCSLRASRCQANGSGMIIAIDGPAASGKGTLGKLIAEHFGLAHLDTGLLYRAVARDVLARGAALDDEQVAVECPRSLDPETLSDPTLRQADIGEAASIVARIQRVR